MPTLTVNVTVRDEAENPLNGSMVRLHRPNKPNKIGAEETTADSGAGAGKAQLTVKQGGLWQLSIVSNNASSTESPVYKLDGTDVTVNPVLTQIDVTNASTNNADPEVDLAFVHDVLQAVAEIYLRCTACRNPKRPWTQAEVDALRIGVRDVIFTELTRPGEPTIPSANPQICAKPGGIEESHAEESESTEGQNDAGSAPLADEKVTPVTPAGIQGILLTCTQCRDYYYDPRSPYYGNYTWYVNCLATCT